jgi:hypothetical protein
MRTSISAAVAAAAAACLTAGCTTASTAKPLDGEALKGTWIYSGTGFERGQPETWKANTMVVESADGQNFTGYVEFPTDGEPDSAGESGQKTMREPFTGVVTPAGDILIVDADGSLEMKMFDGKLQGQYTDGNPTAMNVEMVRK